MRCRFHFNKNDDNIHPLRIKSGYKPYYTCFELENYLEITKLDISHMQISNVNKRYNTNHIKTLKSLRNMQNIIFSKSDNSGSICLINKDHYIKEGLRQLESKYYNEVTQPDLKQIQSKLKILIDNMWEKKEIDETSYEFLKSSLTNEPKICRFFLLPKIHKYDKQTLENIMNGTHNIHELCPCRPIISQINSVTERVSQFIGYFLLPIVKRQNTYIRDSTDLINKLEAIKHPNDCLLATFDITNMYSNMQFDELITAVEKIWDQADTNDYICPLCTNCTGK